MGEDAIDSNAINFQDSFTTDEAAFTQQKMDIDAIKSTELPKLLNCPEFAEKSAQVNALVAEVAKYLKNAEQSKCFGTLFETKFW